MYEPAHMKGVVKLLRGNLWRSNKQNISYFRWKYLDNPFTQGPIGVTAFYGDAVVGFRGYLASSWYIGNKDKPFTILMPCDTVVDPNHRSKGLSVKMGNLAMQQLAARYKIFFNFTAGKTSVPGYLRLGFAPIKNKAYYRNSKFGKDIKDAWRAALRKGGTSGGRPALERKVAFGDFGEIVVSRSPMPEAMARLASGNAELSPQITLLQNEAFFRWRYANVERNYVFYFYRRGEDILGYLAVFVSNNTERAYIVDYGEEGEGIIDRILAYIFQQSQFDEINILNVSVNSALWETLKEHGFRKRYLRRYWRKFAGGEWPLLVRPVNREHAKDDWFLAGLDVRDIENWRLKEIFGDAM